MRVSRIVAFWVACCCLAPLEAERPEHAVLFIIDGLSYKAVEKLPLVNLRALIDTGVYYEKSYNVMPADPKTGEWTKYYTCSIPNPVILAGTAMLLPGQKFVQQSFYPKRITAHVANANSYRSLNVGFNLSFMISRKAGGTDAKAVEWALQFMKGWQPAFLRIHLQSTGSAGHVCQREKNPSKP